MQFTVTEIKKGEKKYGDNVQEGVYVTGEVPSANGPFKKTMHLTFYHNQEMIDIITAAGVGAQLDFKMKAKEGPKGKIFNPVSVSVVKNPPMYNPPKSPTSSEKSQGSGNIPYGSVSNAPAKPVEPVSAAEVLQKDFDVKMKDIFNPRIQAVQYGLKAMEILMGHVLNPKKMTPELFNEMLVKETEFIVALIDGKLVMSPTTSDTSDLQKSVGIKTPDVPDVN